MNDRDAILDTPPMRFILELRRTACLPEADWQGEAQEVLDGLNAAGHELAKEDAAELFLVLYNWLRAKNTLLGRAVQPTKNLSELAPLVGSVRLGDESAQIAMRHLIERLASAIHAPRPSVIRKVADLCAEPLGSHRNFLVWKAISEIMEERVEKSLERGLNEEGTIADPGVVEELIKLVEAVHPDTKEVRDYVSKPENRGRFPGMPTEDAGWTRLWKNSGAKLFIRKATRGKGK